MKEQLQRYKQYLLTGVSYVIPFIASGGILIALAVAFAPMTSQGPSFSDSPLLKLIVDIGNQVFALLLPVLAGYIAYARAGKPALVAGMLGGQISSTIHAGFIGALVAGLLAGWVVELLKKMPVPKAFRPLTPILIIPILSALIVGALMFEVVGVPLANLMVFLADWLKGMGTANAVVLGALLGAMVAFDMGGPINKTAFFFGSAMIAEGNPTIMGAVATAICIPPLGLGLATKLNKKTLVGTGTGSGFSGTGDGLYWYHRRGDPVCRGRSAAGHSDYLFWFSTRQCHCHAVRCCRSRPAWRPDCVASHR